MSISVSMFLGLEGLWGMLGIVGIYGSTKRSGVEGVWGKLPILRTVEALKSACVLSPRARKKQGGYK
jgi:hypothetical protein